MAKLDLHCHSTASDGALPPAELVARAAARGSRMLALTDHDCTAGLAEAGEAAREHGLDLIRGVEISVSWRTRTIHIVGLALTYFHTGNPHYHRREVVSLSCSGWEGVVPPCYGHQA